MYRREEYGMRNMAAEVVPIDVSVMPTRALTASVWEAIIAMCTRAFDQDSGNLFTFVTDSMHVLAYRHTTLVGHVCWASRLIQPAGYSPLHTAYDDAVATDPAYQGCGVGSAVIERLITEIQPYALGGLST